MFNFTWAPSWWDILLLVTYALAILSVPSVLLARRGQPQAALGWVLALFALPVLGLFFWWAIGRQYLRRKRRKRRRAAAHMSGSFQRLRQEIPHVAPADWNLTPFRSIPTGDRDWTFPATAGNRVELLVDSEQFFPALEEAIHDATSHIHLMFYIWRLDPTGTRLRDLLLEKAKQGVEVRVLCDAVGSPKAVKKLLEPLRAAGGSVAEFSPVVFFTRKQNINFRNHRKLVIADGKVGIVSGFNVGDEYMKDWHDLGLRLRGPAVDQLQEVFADDWYFATREDLSSAMHFGQWQLEPSPGEPEGATCAVVASGPHTLQNSTLDALFIAITRANKRIWITTPYLIPDQAIMVALRTAVARGVDVRLLVPAKSDQRLAQLASRSYYPDLIRAGVQLYEFQPKVLHGKSILFDDELAVVGSANMDIRSFKLNFELSCFVNDRALASRLEALYERDLAESQPITFATLRKRSWGAQVLEAAAHLFSPLL